MKRITIKELAKMVNVSPKTVSKALNDKPGVNKELSQKIKKLADKMNYIPNLLGRGLKSNSIKTIGVIIPSSSNPHYSEIIKGIVEKSDEFGYSIILCSSDDDLEHENKQIKLLIQKHVDGIILTPAPDYINSKKKGIEILKKLGISYIFINRYLKGEENNCVKIDNVLGGYIATEYLIKKGHKNIIYLSPHLTPQKINSSAIDRIKGFKKALTENNIPVNNKNIYICDSITLESSYNTMLNILKERRDFTAVFSFNDVVAFGVIKALYECKLRIPSDVAVMGFDDMLYSQICLVPLTTIRQEPYKIGSVATEILINRINGNKNINTKKMIFTPKIIERVSV